MILKNASEKVKEYGFPVIMEYNNPSFHGTQKGVCICIKDNESGKIIENHMPIPDTKETCSDDIEEVRLENLNRLLDDKEILLIEEGITQFEDGKLKPRTIYYLPYYDTEHSILKPTVLYENISGACNVSYDISVEVLFVEDNLNRYVTLGFKTRNVSVMDLVYNLFDQDYIEEELKTAGVYFKEEETRDEEKGFYLDFYDEAGNKYDLCFSRLDRLRDAIVSIRLIGINEKIDEVKVDEN